MNDADEDVSWFGIFVSQVVSRKIHEGGFARSVAHR